MVVQLGSSKGFS